MKKNKLKTKKTFFELEFFSKFKWFCFPRKGTKMFEMAFQILSKEQILQHRFYK